MKKFLTFFTCAFVTPYVLLASIIIVIDPYYVFHKPFFDLKATRTNDPHYVARGLIRNMDYDILLCGTSMCENMHTDHIDEVFGGTSIKVIQHGSYSNDFAASLKQAAKTDKAKKIIMGLDSTMWKKPSEGFRIEEIPDYALDSPNLLNCTSYIFNIDSIKPCIELLKENQDTELERMNYWWEISDSAYGKSIVEKDWLNQKNTGYGLPESEQTLAWQNCNNLLDAIEACQKKGIVIKFFIPPYSVADFSLYNYNRDLEIDKEIWKRLLQYDNVEIYAIQFDTELIQHFEYYRNTSHYNGFVCDTIIDDIAAGKFLLTADNIDERVSIFIQFLDNYDWESLEEKFSNSLGTMSAT